MRQITGATAAGYGDQPSLPVVGPETVYTINIQRKETRKSDTCSPGSFLDEKMLRSFGLTNRWHSTVLKPRAPSAELPLPPYPARRAPVCARSHPPRPTPPR